MTCRGSISALLLIIGICGALQEQSKASAVAGLAEIVPQKRTLASSVNVETWIPGVHYSILSPPVPSAGRIPYKVEVIELFMYTSPISREFQAHLLRWLSTKPAYIEYKREPAIVFPHSRAQARVFYTLAELNREDLHSKLFAWIAQPGHAEIYHQVEAPDEEATYRLSLEFATREGIASQVFTRVYRSPEMNRRLISAESASHAYHIWGTSTICVNGKYSTSVQRLTSPVASEPKPEDYIRLLRLVEYLAASEVVRTDCDNGCAN